MINKIEENVKILFRENKELAKEIETKTREFYGISSPAK